MAPSVRIGRNKVLTFDFFFYTKYKLQPLTDTQNSLAIKMLYCGGSLSKTIGNLCFIFHTIHPKWMWTDQNTLKLWINLTAQIPQKCASGLSKVLENVWQSRLQGISENHMLTCWIRNNTHQIRLDWQEGASTHILKCMCFASSWSKRSNTWRETKSAEHLVWINKYTILPSQPQWGIELSVRLISVLSKSWFAVAL